MIDNVLTVLKDTLNGATDLHDIVVVDNIGKHEDDTSGLDNKVVITLVSVEEESTMKNASRYNQVKVDNIPVRYELEPAPAYLNLYVMISANRTRYSNALINISKIIEIFQTNNVLQYNDLKFRIELHSIPFEQLSYVWGLLGGKVMPSAFYKISVVKIAADTPPIDIELIDEVDVKSIKID